MPTMNPVIAMAHPIRRSPNAPTSTAAIFCAAPLSTTSFPSIAPLTITIVSAPRMSPIPFLTAPATSVSGMPNATAAPADTSTNARNGCTLAHTTSTISVMIAAATMARLMGS